MMFLNKYLVMLAMFTSYVQGSQSQPPGCYLPTGRPATCVPISQCVYMQKLIANLQKPLPSDVALLIRESFFCGSAHGQVSVCCPVDGLGNRLGEVPGRPHKHSCHFQDHLQSSCVTYSQCLPFAHLVGNLRKPILPAVGSIVRSAYMCGFSDQEGHVVPKVCCPSEGIVASEVLSTAHFSSMEETTESTEEDAKHGELKDHPGREFLANEYSCGISLVINREENKGPASVGQYPWLVLLGYSNTVSSIVDYKCGGTLIGSRHILTAAHCVCGAGRSTVYPVATAIARIARSRLAASRVPLVVPLR